MATIFFNCNALLLLNLKHLQSANECDLPYLFMWHKLCLHENIQRSLKNTSTDQHKPLLSSILICFHGLYRPWNKVLIYLGFLWIFLFINLLLALIFYSIQESLGRFVRYMLLNSNDDPLHGFDSVNELFRLSKTSIQTNQNEFNTPNFKMIQSLNGENYRKQFVLKNRAMR